MFRIYICFEFCVEQVVDLLSVIIDLSFKWVTYKVSIFLSSLQEHSNFISDFVNDALFLKAQVIFFGNILN